ncbi:MAG: hypothetical protein ACAI43_10100 [Phycisphaerae bacterium]
MRLAVAGWAGLASAATTSASVASDRALISARIACSSASVYVRWSSGRAVDRGASVPRSRRCWTSRRTHAGLHPNCAATSVDDPHSSYAAATASRKSIE